MEKRSAARYGFGAFMVFLGALISHLGIGSQGFAFGSVGLFLIYAGFSIIMITTMKAMSWRRERKVDERMLFVASKASRITFLSMMIISFVIIVIDGISPISMPYHLFISYLVCVLLLVYYASYRILLKKY